jgi:hypothetical protein
VAWPGITISSVGEEMVKDFPGNTKMTQIAERDAERRVSGFAHRVQAGKARRSMGGQDHLPRHLWCTAWIGKGSSPALPETTFDRKQQKLIGSLFTGRLDVRNLAHLNGLTHRLPIACPQLEAIHGSPP